MKTTRKYIIGAFALTAGAVVIFTQTAWTDRGIDPLRLEGAWMATAPGTTMVWTYTYARSDASGTTATVQGAFHVGVDPTLSGLFPQAQYLTPLVGEAELMGARSARHTLVASAMKNGLAGPEVVYTVVVFGTVVKTDAGKVQGNYHYHIYTPQQLAHAGGVPHPGETPSLCVCIQSVQTRIAMFPSFTKNCGD